MAKSLIVYFSQGGTTTKVAESIADGLRREGYQVDLHSIKEKQQPDLSGYDLLGIGSPVYFYRPPFIVTDYLNSLPDLGGCQLSPLSCMVPTHSIPESQYGGFWSTRGHKR